MILDFKTDEFLPCVCGHTPTEYSCGYGSTPYNVYCKCGKSLMLGSHGVFFQFWNDCVRHINEPNGRFGLCREYRGMDYYNCPLRIWPPLVYRMDGPFGAFRGKPLNKYRIHGRFAKLPDFLADLKAY